MHHTYVLLAEVDGRFDIGAMKDLKRRVAQHEAGLRATATGDGPKDLMARETGAARLC